MPSLLSERYTVPKLLYLSTKKYHRICLFQDSSFIQSSYFLPSALPAMYSPLPLRLRDSVWSEIEVWRSDDVGLTLKRSMSQLSNALVIPNRNKWEYLEYSFLEGRASLCSVRRKEVCCRNSFVVSLFPVSSIWQQEQFQGLGPHSHIVCMNEKSGWPL